MRFAALADIHGNSAALDAALADIAAQGVSEIVILGDHLSGPLAARAVADRLLTLDAERFRATVIRGNHDRYLIEQDRAQMGGSDRAALDQISPAHLDWLRSLPATARYRDSNFLCHGTPQEDDVYWLHRVRADAVVEPTPLPEIERRADAVDASLMLCAHTHLARAVRLRDGRLVVNPGSVGCPGYIDAEPVRHVVQSGTPHACYAILDGEGARWNVTFRQVAYDPTEMVRLAERAGRKEWADALATGWVDPPR